MKYFYDLHIHSGLSPCADNNMSPINIVAAASAMGLDLIAISDHNSIKNVKLSIEIGKILNIVVVPAIELQTNEDIHILCLFETYQNLVNFYNSIQFTDMQNKVEVFGNQYVFDGDDNIVEEEKSLLIASANISESEVLKLAINHSGIAIPAHIDRDAFGMVSVLGSIPEGYTSVELSRNSSQDLVDEYKKNYHIILDSDAHTLGDIGIAKSAMELTSLDVHSLIKFLMSKK